MSRSGLRIALGADGVSIWSAAIFGGDEPSRVRDFIARAFAVQEVEGIELRRKTSFGRIRYGAVANPTQIWRKLSRALTAPADVLTAPEEPPAVGARGGSARRIDAGHVYLDAPGRVRIHRIGNVLSTWHVREHGESTLRLSHPALRNRRDVVYRLEEELASIFGVEEFRASALSAGVSIRFDASATTAERLAWELERAWPRLLEGLDGPPSRKRLFSSVGLLGLAYTGQYLVPAVRPIAVAGMTIYTLPNVVKAAKQLTRGEVGLAALYTTGVGFMLSSGLPFAASVFAVLMQLWPHLAHQKIVSSQRRLFAAQRRRPRWARIAGAGGSEVGVDDLRKDDRILVRSGEVIPVDGHVEDGSAVVVERDPFGGSQIESRSRGEAVGAGAVVRDGDLTIRVERAAGASVAGYVDSLLPHASIIGLPSALEAERIANRNAKPALAVAALSLLATRTLLPAQAVIRPDYATAPRLSAQLSALRAIAVGLSRGVLFRNPAVLDRLAAVDLIVIDESAGLHRRRLQVARVEAVRGVSVEQVVSYAWAAHTTLGNEQRRALAAIASKLKAERPRAESIRRSAGVTRYRDSLGSALEIATPGYLAASKIEAPQRFHTALTRRSSLTAAPPEPARTKEEPLPAPLWVVRDGEAIGAIAFARTGEVVGHQVALALAAQNDRARIVYVSRGGGPGARELARQLGIEFSEGGLSRLSNLNGSRPARETLWVGDGSAPGAEQRIVASTISISVAPLSRYRDDAADIHLPQQGVASLPEALAIGRAHSRRLEKDYQTVYAVNLLAVAGAILGNFNGLQSGLLSNAGTGIVYARHALALDRLASAAEKRRARRNGVDAP